MFSGVLEKAVLTPTKMLCFDFEGSAGGRYFIIGCWQKRPAKVYPRFGGSSETTRRSARSGANGKNEGMPAQIDRRLKNVIVRARCRANYTRFQRAWRQRWGARTPRLWFLIGRPRDKMRVSVRGHHAVGPSAVLRGGELPQTGPEGVAPTQGAQTAPTLAAGGGP